MNRADRRRSGKTEKVKVYTITEEQLENHKNRARAEGFLMSLSIPVMVLHDKFGFGEERLNRFLDPCIVWINGIQSGEVKIQEILEISEQLAKIQFISNDIKQKKLF